MAYHQPPYQTTVMQPVVVQQPIVVPVVSGRNWGRNWHNGPSYAISPPDYIRNGARLCGISLPGPCVIIGTFIGCGMLLIGCFMLFSVNWDTEFWGRFGMDYDPILVPACSLLIVGGILSITFLWLCMNAKKNYKPVQPSTGVHVAHADPQNSSGHIYSGQGNPAIRQPVAAGSPMVVPMQSGGAVYSQSTVVSYPNTAPQYQINAMQQVPQPAPQYQINSVQQAPQPGINTFPGTQPYPQPPPYSGQEKAFSPEYNQQSAYAPPPSYGPSAP